MWEARSQVWMLTAVLSPSIALAVGILQEWFLAAGTGYITPLALFSHFSSPVITHPVKSNLLRSDSIIFLWACNMFFVNLCNWIYHPKYFMLNILERNGQVLDSFLLWISKINIFFMLIDCVYKTLVPNSYRAHPAFNKAVKLFFLDIQIEKFSGCVQLFFLNFQVWKLHNTIAVTSWLKTDI